MEFTFQAATLLLLIAAVVGMLTKRLRLPYSVGLVVAGIALAAIPWAPRIVLTKQLIYTGLLPPLLFEAAYHIEWDGLRRNALVLGSLATLGVVLSAAVTAAGMHFFAHWAWMAALVFGTLIAATDPVSVIAIFREAEARERLLLLIEAESLLNDGTASVAFAVAVAIATGQSITVGGALFTVLKMIGGGVACGAAFGVGSLLLTGRTNDHLIELTFTTVAAYGSFLFADFFGMSGVLATITAGLVMRNLAQLDDITRRGKQAVSNFWEYAAFIANSMIFLLIGTEQKNQHFLAIWALSMIAVGVVLAARVIAVFCSTALFHWSSLRVSARHQSALVWGGLRGALALALALGLPPDLPQHDEIVTVSFGVVAFSIFVQGLTMKPFLRRIGEFPAGKAAVRAESGDSGAVRK